MINNNPESTPTTHQGSSPAKMTTGQHAFESAVSEYAALPQHPEYDLNGAQAVHSYHDSICSHLYHNCYLQGLYSDLHVHIQSSQKGIDGLLFKLHRIMALRSPVLSSLMGEQESSDYSLSNISLAIDDPNITQEGLSIAFGHLYGSFSQSLLGRQVGPDRSLLLRSVLAAAHLLHLGDLAALALDHIKADIGFETVLGYCMLVTSEHFSSHPTHVLHQSQDTPSISMLRYGASYTEIREALFSFLTKGILFELVDRYGLIWSNKSGEAYKRLVNLFAELPFDLLKRVVECKAFEVPSDMERFTFAKEIVSARAKAAKYGSPVVRGEENVLLSFGSNANSDTTAVALVRKLPRGSMVMPNVPSTTTTSSNSTHVMTSSVGGMTSIPVMMNADASSLLLANNNAFGFPTASAMPERRLWKYQQ